MEQRPLRLGDIVDDYCPRERRITNHAIVALVEQEIRQTRCATCDAEHVYKEAKVPRRRRGDEGLGAGEEGGTMTPGQLVTRTGSPGDESTPTPVAADSAPTDPAPPDDTERSKDGWLSHRPLIRASLPRTAADPPPPRPIPVFTMHQRSTRGSQAFRQGGNGGNDRGPEVNGNTFHGSHGHGPHGSGQGPDGNPGGHGHGPGGGHARRRRRHGKRGGGHPR
jgi:hypothetical protein